MAYSYTEYTAASGNDTNTAYTTPNYLTDRGATDITVTVDGTIKGTATYNLSGTSITFTTGNLPAVGAKIKITRSSSQSSRLNDYSDASLLTADTLDADANQLFFVAQEAFDQAASLSISDATDTAGATNRLSIGAGDDLLIYHNGNDSYIKETNSSGSLIIQGENFFVKNADSQPLVTSGGESVQLAHCPDASTSNQRLETTPSGINVTGTVTPSGGYKSSDGTAGFTGSASASATLTIKDGLIVAVS